MASFGARLKQEREQRGVTLNDISQSTKISTRLLSALEDEHFNLLPGGIFNKGFVRAYARHLGLDEDQTVADFLEATGAVPRDKKPEGGGGESPVHELRVEVQADEAPNLPWGLFAVALLLVALGLAGWGFYSREGHPGPKQKAAPAPSAAAPQNEPVAGATPAGAAMTAVSTVAPVGAAAVPATENLTLRIGAEDDSWVSIKADGKLILEDTLAAGEEKSVRAAKEITVRSGNPGALDFELNGKKLTIPAGAGEVLTLVFDGNGWHRAPKPVPAPETVPKAP